MPAVSFVGGDVAVLLRAKVAIWLSMGVLAVCACSGESGGVTCPTGTTRLGDMCIVRGSSPRSDMGMPSLDAALPPAAPFDGGSLSDAVMTPADGDLERVEAGLDAGAPMGDGATPPPVPPPPPPPPGPCADVVSCGGWARALVDGVNAYRTGEGGCSTPLAWDDRVGGVARDDAEAMAESDSLTGGLRDLVGSVRMAGISPSSMSTFGGTTRVGPTDVLDRWLTRAEVASRFADCNFDLAGAGFASDAAGDETYGRLILVAR